MPVDEKVVLSKISDALKAAAEVEEITSRPYADLDDRDRAAVRYKLIVLVEALVGLCAHLAVEGLGETPGTYREAVRLVVERTTPECSGDLEALVGLRNVLVHRYWEVSDSEIYEDVRRDFECLRRFLSKVREEYSNCR